MPKISKIQNLGLDKEKLSVILENCTRIDICEHFKISERTLDRIIQQNGLTNYNLGPKNLSIQTIHDIRNLYQTGNYKQKEIADKFNISQSLVSKIINNQVHKNHKHLKLSGQASAKIGYKYGN